MPRWVNHARASAIFLLFGLLFLASCQGLNGPVDDGSIVRVTLTNEPVTIFTTPSPTPTAPPGPVVFAIIADYGDAGRPARDVADLVKSWQPDFIVTAGDNNYFNGEASTIDENIGQYYHQFIYPYRGDYGEGADVNRFFPALGGHDWRQPNAQPHLDYFTLPGNERYYDVRWGPVHIFILDSNDKEPDGVTSDSTQAQWLQAGLSASDAPWKLVVAHDPPYSSGESHGSQAYMQWPFQEWGATAIISGNDHIYERIVMDGFPYFVNGLGGGRRYRFDRDDMVPESEVQFNSDHGAMRVEADEERIIFQFITHPGEVIDEYVVEAMSDE